MKTDAVVVKNSKIEGKGVFALRNFKKGEIVLHWDVSNSLKDADVKKMSNQQKEYICFLEGKYVKMQEPEKYANHSCNSNTKAQKFCDVAIKNIKKGEEITGNYEEVIPLGFYMECSCGSKNCKKIIKS